MSALFGLIFLIAPGSRLLAAYNRQVVAAFHGTAAPAAALEQQRWAIAVLGSSILGWSVLLLWVVSVPFGRREPWAWRCVAVSVAAWVMGDSIVSYRAGITLELLWNVVVAVLVALPLAMTWRTMSAGCEAAAVVAPRMAGGSPH